MSVLRGIARALRGVLLALAALVLFIEEWGWRPLTAWAARLALWPPLARLEARIQRLPPRAALALFLVPAVALLPVKLLALWAIQQGHTLLGVAVIVAAKLLGTALVGRLFILTEAQLTHFAWFAASLAWWRRTKARIKAAVHALPLWQALRAAVRRWRLWWRRAGR